MRYAAPNCAIYPNGGMGIDAIEHVGDADELLRLRIEAAIPLQPFSPDDRRATSPRIGWCGELLDGGAAVAFGDEVVE